MKIFLIFSRKLTEESYDPPIGIMSLAAVLRQNGYTDIKLFDMAFHSKDLIVRECMNGEPDAIGLSNDSIPFPARDLLPMDKYLKTSSDIPMLYPSMIAGAVRQIAIMQLL